MLHGSVIVLARICRYLSMPNFIRKFYLHFFIPIPELWVQLRRNFYPCIVTRSLTGSGVGNIPILHWKKYSIRKYTYPKHLRKQWNFWQCSGCPLLCLEEHASHLKLYTTKLHEPFRMRLVMQILPSF